MKKIMLLILTIILTIILYGCSKPWAYESSKSVEALFSLPQNTHIISETYTFSPTNFIDLSYESFMTVKIVYAIQNDGEDTNMKVFVPFLPSSMRTVKETMNNLSVKSNDQDQTINWDFRFDYDTFKNYDNLTYDNLENGLITEDIYTFSENIYSYFFTAPMIGTDRELVVQVPEGTHIFSDYYSVRTDAISSYSDGLFIYENSIINVPATKLLTTGRFHTIGEEAEFTGNYNYGFSSYSFTLQDWAYSYGYDEMQAKMQKYAVRSFYNSDELSMEMNDIDKMARYATDFISVFSSDILLAGNGETTIIEVAYPFLHGLYSNNKEETAFIYYDFYFDSERYLNNDIDVIINLEESTELFSCNYELDGSNIIFDISKGNYLKLTYQIEWYGNVH